MAASLSAIPGLPMRATPELHQDGVLPSLTYFLGLLMECWWDRVDVLVTHMVGSTFLSAWPWDCLISIVSGNSGISAISHGGRGSQSQSVSQSVLRVTFSFMN